MNSSQGKLECLPSLDAGGTSIGGVAQIDNMDQGVRGARQAVYQTQEREGLSGLAEGQAHVQAG